MVNILKAADANIAYLRPSGSYMTVSGAALWIGLVQQHDLTESEGRTDIRYVGGATRNPSIFIDQQPDYSGTIRYYMQDGQFLTFAMGSVANTGSPNYLHTISQVDNPSKQLPYFELHESKNAPTTPLSRKIAGCTIDSISIRGRMGDPIEAEVQYTAGSTAFLAAMGSTATASTAVPYMWDDGLIKITGAAMNGDLLEVMEFEWSMENNPEHPYYIGLGGRYKGESIPGNRDTMLSITMKLSEASGGNLYDKFHKGGSAFNTTVFLFRTSGTDSATTADTLRIVMSGCKLTSMEMPTPHEGDGLEQTIEIKPTGTTTILVRDTTETYPFYL